LTKLFDFKCNSNVTVSVHPKSVQLNNEVALLTSSLLLDMDRYHFDVQLSCSQTSAEMTVTVALLVDQFIDLSVVTDGCWDFDRQCPLPKCHLVVSNTYIDMAENVADFLMHSSVGLCLNYPSYCKIKFWEGLDARLRTNLCVNISQHFTTC